MRTEEELLKDRDNIIVRTIKDFATLNAQAIEYSEQAFIKGNQYFRYRRTTDLNDHYFWSVVSPLRNYISHTVEEGETTKNITVHFS